MALELAEIVRQYGAAYQARYGARLLPSQRRALRDIERCRTAALGGQMIICRECDHIEYRYHSCRNRHCPKCQQTQAEAWLDEQQACLLPVPYALVTFTLPAALRRLARAHQRQYYDVLFRAAAMATQKLAQDPRFIGGQVGMMGVLHTWTRDLRYHPHVHFLVPAGGLAADGVTWRPARRGFLLPVKALSRLFRAEFQRLLRGSETYKQIPEAVWSEPWVVHSKSVGNGQTALKYLAPYIFRVALSNRRLVKMEDGRVTFRYIEARTHKTCFCTLPVDAFLQRFLQHVLPKGFVKVRYYGLFAPAHRAQLLALQKRLARSIAARKPAPPTALASSERSDPPRRCAVCGSEVHLRPLLRASARCPPHEARMPNLQR